MLSGEPFNPTFVWLALLPANRTEQPIVPRTVFEGEEEQCFLPG
jgi:hypothetical protein